MDKHVTFKYAHIYKNGHYWDHWRWEYKPLPLPGDLIPLFYGKNYKVIKTEHLEDLGDNRELIKIEVEDKIYE